MQAYIAKIAEDSTMYFSGRAVLFYFAGCDFACPFCNTYNMLKHEPGFLIEDLRELKKALESRLAEISHLVFTGGEPCLQMPALLYLAEQAKKLGLKVVVETNASKPESIRRLIASGFIDYIAADIKAPFEQAIFERATKSSTFFISSAEIMANIRQSIMLLKESSDRIIVEFRTTVVPGLLYKKEDFLKIAEAIADDRVIWTLRAFRPDNVASKRFSELQSPSQEFIVLLRESIQRNFPMLRVQIEES